MRVLHLKRAWQLATAAMFIVTLLILAACGEDEPKVDPVTVQFTSAAQTITEDGGARNITLSLSSAAKKDGTLTLSVAPANANTLAAFPTEINVTKGSTSAQFTLTPVNNAIIDANAKIITFTLDDATSGFELGTQVTHAVTITDDEGPTTANFTVASGTVAESASGGINVAITLSPAADVAGTIEITMTPTDAAVTTTPAATAGVLSVPVTVGQTSVSFNVTPQNNTADGDDLEIDFEITNATGGVIVGTNVDYALTVDDDDDIVPVPIADVRAMYTGSDVTINTDTYIEGVVISSGSNVTNRNVFLQDESGAVVVRFTVAHAYVQGDELLINLNGVLLTKDAGSGNTGPLQLGGSAGLDAAVKVTKTGTDDVPAAQTVSLTDLNGGAFEGKLIKVENVFFPDADGILKLTGSRTLSNGTTTTIVRSESYSPWQDSAIPLGSGTIEGLASIFNGAVQVLPLEASDIFDNAPIGTLGTTGTLADFGSVNNGAESTEQSYTVQGTTLTHDIVVTASSGYKVSLTSGSGFGSSVTILAANANAATTIFVKFAPTTGVNQAVAGTLTHKSQGAASALVNVTGTEAGNGASVLALDESFNYGASDNGDITAATSNWTRHGGAQGPQYSASGLTYTGHPASGIAGAISFTFGSSGANDGDANRTFTKFEGNGSIYISFLVDLSAARATSDYFFHVGQNVIGTGFRARVHARSNGAGWSFGFQKNGDTRVDDNTVLNFNQTYLVVLKYTINTATATDDLVSLYVYDSGIPASEPGSPLITIGPTGNGGASDIVDIGSVAVRQSSNSPTGKIDAIRVATVWADLFN